MQSSALSSHELSELIGKIYDCTLAPQRWPEAIEAVCQATNCMAGLIAISDFTRPQVQLAHFWNYEPAWIARTADYAEEVAANWKAVPDLMQRPLDEPGAIRRELPDDFWNNSRFTREWLVPQGIHDSIHLIVVREPTRIGEFTISRHVSAGLVGDAELDLMRLLAPHIRRAITISDALDLKNFEAGAMDAAINALSVGVVLVDTDGQIAKTNIAAEAMLASGTYVSAKFGRLGSSDRETAAELQQAIATASTHPAEIGALGIGVPLRAAGQRPAMAHVLPLAPGNLNTRLLPSALAAVFLLPPGFRSPADLEGVGRACGLTPAELRLLERLVAGETVASAARALGIARSTANTHLLNTFSKTGVNRQPDLIALVAGMLPPVQNTAAT